MHKLDRSQTTPPPCLLALDPDEHDWDSPETCSCKPAIRTALKSMQGDLCAYCESPHYDDAHIEHFRRKNQLHHPDKKYLWDNLFLSCQSHDHCGHYKDQNNKAVPPPPAPPPSPDPHKPPYHPDDLIKPDVDDPDQYLYFHNSGEVRVSDRAMTGREKHRATLTIRVFGLDAPTLTAFRRDAVKRYQREPYFSEILELPESQRSEFLREEIDKTTSVPYCTTIRHFLERQL